MERKWRETWEVLICKGPSLILLASRTGPQGTVPYMGASSFKHLGKQFDQCVVHALLFAATRAGATEL